MRFSPCIPMRKSPFWPQLRQWCNSTERSIGAPFPMVASCASSHSHRNDWGAWSRGSSILLISLWFSQTEDCSFKFWVNSPMFCHSADSPSPFISAHWEKRPHQISVNSPLPGGDLSPFKPVLTTLFQILHPHEDGFLGNVSISILLGGLATRKRP